MIKLPVVTEQDLAVDLLRYGYDGSPAHEGKWRNDINLRFRDEWLTIEPRPLRRMDMPKLIRRQIPLKRLLPIVDLERFCSVASAFIASSIRSYDRKSLEIEAESAANGARGNPIRDAVWCSMKLPVRVEEYDEPEGESTGSLRIVDADGAWICYWWPKEVARERFDAIARAINAQAELEAFRESVRRIVAHHELGADSVEAQLLAIDAPMIEGAMRDDDHDLFERVAKALNAQAAAEKLAEAVDFYTSQLRSELAGHPAEKFLDASKQLSQALAAYREAR